MYDSIRLKINTAQLRPNCHGWISIRSFILEMEKVELPTFAVKLPKNLRCLLIGASESGKFDYYIQSAI